MVFIIALTHDSAWPILAPTKAIFINKNNQRNRNNEKRHSD